MPNMLLYFWKMRIRFIRCIWIGTSRKWCIELEWSFTDVVFNSISAPTEDAVNTIFWKNIMSLKYNLVKSKTYTEHVRVKLRLQVNTSIIG